MFDFARFRADYLEGKIIEKKNVLWKKYNAARWAQPPDPVYKQLWAEYVKIPDQNMLHTLYCSTVAHLRGRLHLQKVGGYTLHQLGKPLYEMKKAERDARLISEVHQIYKWTLEDQAELVEPIIREYQTPGPVCRGKQLPLL